MDPVVVKIAWQESTLGNGHIEVGQQLRRSILLHAVQSVSARHAAAAEGSVFGALPLRRAPRHAARRDHVAVDRVEHAEQGLRQLRADFPAVEAVVPDVPTRVLSPEASRELAQGSSAEDGVVSCLEVVIDDEAAIVNQAVAVHRVEDIRVDINSIRRDEDAARQQLLSESIRGGAHVLHDATPRLCRLWPLCRRCAFQRLACIGGCRSGQVGCSCLRD
mmetsp:Transcript_47325/g.124910  ORF Transcript_47325/g.124910 Transcript_47325/m.124910 type:complete len:219 (-) Transcript_47325:3493-4149(-)